MRFHPGEMALLLKRTGSHLKLERTVDLEMERPAIHMPAQPRVPNVLTIAGSDSGGGAGIQADLKTIAAMGGFGMSVITALTAQNGLGVTGIHAPEPAFVALQLTTVLEGFPVAAAKTGMLFSAGIIEAVAQGLANVDFPLVVDPVCVSQTGHPLLREDAVDALRSRMLPLARILTPNRPEAELLAGLSIDSGRDVAEAIARLLDMGPSAVLLKGGHFEEGALVDWLGLPGQAPIPLPQDRLDTMHTHGTGCALSAAIACGLAVGLDALGAVKLAYLREGLAAGFAPGKGVGPPDHMARYRALTPLSRLVRGQE